MTKSTVRTQATDEADLVRRAQDGDREAFAELFNRLHQPVLNYVYHTLGDLPSAEDVTQDAFIRAHQHLARLGPPWDFKSWVYRIASNLAIDDLRRNRRLVDMPEEAEETGPMPEAPTTRRPLERKVQQDELRRGVWRSLDQMPTAHRQALILRELCGLSYDEVGLALECSYQNARQLVHRARLRFREIHGLRVVMAGAAVHCRTLGDLISAYHDGELGKQERKAVEAHIASCPDCRETRDDLKKVGALFAGIVPVLPSPEWTARLLERLAAGPPGSPGGGQPPQPAASGAGGGGGAGSAGATSGLGGGAGPAVSASGLGGGLLLPVLAIGAPLLGFGLLVGGWLLLGGGFLATPTPSPTAVAGPPTAAPSATAAAEATSTPALSPTGTSTPTVSLTPTAEPPSAYAPQDVNCRHYPGTNGSIIGTFHLGAAAPIDGRDAASTWWWIPNPDGAGHCWVWSGAVDERGDLSGVPLILVPTPTPSGCWVRYVTQGNLVCIAPCPPNALPGGACQP